MAKKGFTQQSTAAFNRRNVLDVIRRRGEMGRKELVDIVKLSPQTVANITQDLEVSGLLVSRRQKIAKSRGQPPIAFDINPEGGGAIGIGLEPGRISAALVNQVGDVLLRYELEADTNDPLASLEVMKEIVEKIKSVSPLEGRIWGIGVAMPGPFGDTEISFVGPTSFEGWRDLSIFDELEEQTGMHVFYSVDSTAGALGESLFGVARNLENFFYIHFGVGLGGALVIDQVAHKGANGNATEFGHIPVVPEGRACYCGNNGCLERYLSLHSLAEVLGLSDVQKLNRTEIANLLEKGDQRVIDWCQKAAGHLRRAICIVENTLDTQSIVIGGSAPRILVETIMDKAMPLRKSVRGGITEPEKRVLLSERQDDSAILGAAVLPIHEMLAPRYDVLVQRSIPSLKPA